MVLRHTYANLALYLIVITSSTAFVHD